MTLVMTSDVWQLTPMSPYPKLALSPDPWFGGRESFQNGVTPSWESLGHPDPGQHSLCFLCLDATS
jgi:hypothetical protein